MNKIVLNIKKEYLLFISILIIILFLIVFLPMSYQLERQVKENYGILAESKRQTITALFDNCGTSANSISSRTPVRDLILDFNSGKISWSELEELTYPKYSDGIKIIRNLSFAVRCVGDVPLALYNPGGKEADRYLNLFDRSTETSYKYEEEGDRSNIIVYSPILYQKKLIAYDIIVIDISQEIFQLSSDGFKVKILESGSPLLEDIKPEKLYDRHLGQQNYMCVAKPVVENLLVFISKPTNDVYANINRVSLFSILGFFLGLSLIFIVLYMSLVRAANRMIENMENSRDTCLNYANYDSLTGAYTRFFFDNWIKSENNEIKKQQFVVAMIDVDSFKGINDTYGHETGDNVLKFITSTLSNMLRENDFVVRFGGDEFIVVIEEISENPVLKLLGSVNQNLSDTNRFGFHISISYGVEVIESVETIYESIKKADKKMYINKKENKPK
ncbi:GGDEF domain-containing protein [Lacrimispora sp.]|uniref:GGDEF domain-containing protein n=1 Tax=Lacrimispora sp. TaxID=2719234 RepID=UPI00289A2646|nr:GGDEF domain-containing protein [Lacrimispora sp.]